MSKHSLHMPCQAMHDVQCMTAEELEQTYNLEIDDDGYVWDICESVGFGNVQLWAEYIQYQELLDDSQYVLGARSKHEWREQDY